MPSRQPRKPSIGLNSCSSLTRSAIASACDADLLGQLRLRPCRRAAGTRAAAGRAADRDRPALHRPEHAVEVLALERQQLGQGLLAVVGVVGQDHLAHRRRCGRRTCARCGTGRCLRRRRRSPAAAWSGSSALVRTLQLAVLVGPLHQLGELLIDLATAPASASCRSAPGRPRWAWSRPGRRTLRR